MKNKENLAGVRKDSVSKIDIKKAAVKRLFLFTQIVISSKKHYMSNIEGSDTTYGNELLLAQRDWVESRLRDSLEGVIEKDMNGADHELPAGSKVISFSVIDRTSFLSDKSLHQMNSNFGDLVFKAFNSETVPPTTEAWLAQREESFDRLKNGDLPNADTLYFLINHEGVQGFDFVGHETYETELEDSKVISRRLLTTICETLRGTGLYQKFQKIVMECESGNEASVWVTNRPELLRAIEAVAKAVNSVFTFGGYRNGDLNETVLSTEENKIVALAHQDVRTQALTHFPEGIQPFDSGLVCLGPWAMDGFWSKKACNARLKPGQIDYFKYARIVETLYTPEGLNLSGVATVIHNKVEAVIEP